MLQLSAHFEGHPEGTCSCGVLGTMSLVLRAGSEELVIGPHCNACMLNSPHAGWMNPPKIPTGGPPTERMKRTSKRQEKRVAAGVGAQTSLASGAMASDKSDARIRGVLRIENKFTYGTTFALSRQILTKIRSECVGRETPMLQIEFKDRATNKTQDAWACVPYQDWEKLFNDSASEHR